MKTVVVPENDNPYWLVDKLVEMATGSRNANNRGVILCWLACDMNNRPVRVSGELIGYLPRGGDVIDLPELGDLTAENGWLGRGWTH